MSEPDGVVPAESDATRRPPPVGHAGAAAADLGTDDVALVITPVAVPDALAAACALAKVQVDVVPTVVGAVAVCRDPAGPAPRAAAETISRLLRDQTVLLLHRVAGQVDASRWSAGAEQASVAPGLVLDGAPSEVDGLVLGTRTVADFDGVVPSTGMSRWRAARTLSRLARGRHPRGRGQVESAR